MSARGTGIRGGTWLPSGGPLSLSSRALRRLSPDLLVHEHLLILRKELTSDPLPRTRFRLAEYKAFEGLVLDLHHRLEREHGETRLRQRFDHGLWFYALWEGDRLAATTWVVTRGERFVDEIGLGFPVGKGDVWMRDIFVAPDFRGRGVFAVLLDHVLAGPFHGRRALWSAVNASNRLTLRAHQKYGHVPVAHFELLHFFRRFALRLRWPRPLPSGSSFEPDRRLILTGSRYRRFVEARSA